MTSEAPVKRAKKKPAGRFHHGDLAEQLVVAATALVEKKGHTALSLREVAAKVGVTEPALYRHYDGRDALLAEVALRGFLRFVDTLRAEVRAAPSDDPYEGLRRYGRSYVRYCVANPGWFRLQFSRAWNEELGKRPAVAARLLAAQDARQELLAVMSRCLPPGDDRVADLYRLVWGTVHGLAGFVVERVFQLVQTDEERVAAADVAIDMLIESLRARATSR